MRGSTEFRDNQARSLYRTFLGECPKPLKGIKPTKQILCNALASYWCLYYTYCGSNVEKRGKLWQSVASSAFEHVQYSPIRNCNFTLSLFSKLSHDSIETRWAFEFTEWLDDRGTFTINLFIKHMMDATLGCHNASQPTPALWIERIRTATNRKSKETNQRYKSSSLLSWFDQGALRAKVRGRGDTCSD